MYAWKVILKNRLATKFQSTGWPNPSEKSLGKQFLGDARPPARDSLKSSAKFSPTLCVGETMQFCLRKLLKITFLAFFFNKTNLQHDVFCKYLPRFPQKLHKNYFPHHYNNRQNNFQGLN